MSEQNYELRDNSGTIFKNESKKSDTHADYSGKVKVGNVEYYISLWVKEGKSGKKFFGVGFKPINGEYVASGSSAPKQEPKKDDSDLPF